MAVTRLMPCVPVGSKATIVRVLLPVGRFRNVQERPVDLLEPSAAVGRHGEDLGFACRVGEIREHVNAIGGEIHRAPK